MRRAQGQALVEFMLGSVSAVSILVAGLYLSEQGFIRLKLHEAAAFAAYDATGRSVYELDRNGTTSELGDVSGNSVTDPAGMATQRYKNLDGRGSGGGVTVTQVATKLSSLNVHCNRIASLDMPLARKPVWVAPGSENPKYVQIVNLNHAAYPNNLEVDNPGLAALGNYGPHYDDLMDAVDTLLPGQGGMGCRASATVAAPIANLLGSIFGASLIKNASMTMCAPGDCSGRYAMLVGDYSLSSMSSDPNINDDCRLNACQNNRYRDVVEGLYDANIHKSPMWFPGSAVTLVNWVGKADPTGGAGIDKFFMSFSGEESGYMDGFVSGTGTGNVNLRNHNTSGVNTRGGDTPTSWNGCWMGMGASNAWDSVEKYMQRCY